MKRARSEYERTLEIAKRLFMPAWIRRYHGGDEEAAAERLASEYGFEGRAGYMRYLAELVLDNPDRDEFEQAVREYHQTGLRLMAERLTALLRAEGFRVNHKRVERLWRREGLKVPERQRPRRRLWLNDGSCVRLRPAHPNHVWSYDFVTARTTDGRAFRLLTVIDEYTRECLAIA